MTAWTSSELDRKRVYPDGLAIILTEGILRARYRNSFTNPELLKPGVIYELHYQPAVNAFAAWQWSLREIEQWMTTPE